MNISKNQQGFSPVEGVLLVVIVLIVGFVGWKVYDTSKESTKTNESALKASDQKTDKASDSTADPKPEEASDTMPEGWTSYTSAKGGFSFAYPEKWGTVTETIDGPGYDDCSIACGQTLSLAFSSLDSDFEVRGKTMDYVRPKDASDLSLAQKGYVKSGSEVKIYGYSPITQKGQVPDADTATGTIKTNAKGIEYFLQQTDRSDDVMVASKYDVSNIQSAIFNAPTNDANIAGLAISLGVTKSNEGVFEQIVDSVEFK